METTKIAETPWELTPQDHGSGYVSTDYVIDAYLKGKQDGIDSVSKALKKIFTSNINFAGVIVKEFIEYLSTKDIVPQRVFLKTITIDSFQVMVVVTETQFLSEEILLAYNKITELEERAKQDEEDSISLEFILSDADLESNKDAIALDGFTLTFSEV